MSVEWKSKAWGRTQCVHSSDRCSVHNLDLFAGGYCSLHFHRDRANRFHVTSGQVAVVEYYGPQIETTLLTAGDTHDVRSLVPHLFVVYSPAQMTEEYWPDRGGRVEEDDIVRLVQGGTVQVTDLPTLPARLLAQYKKGRQGHE